MSQALYRKYRSKSLDELVGQDHITRALSASIKSGKISHAYLFTGPRGTGKTSVARILAHDLNDIPYDESITHIDIIEIDAASNRRIDEIRDLREKVQIAPTSLKYKVYIIDEVHMLTKEAFNALLKTLEEPPEHAIFVLATTELHKVPDTIISRTQRYAFKPIEKLKIIQHLKTIASSEKIIVDEDALAAIADHAEGGFRDAIGLLDQVRHTTDHITVESVMDALGVPPAKAVDDLWDNLQSKTPDATSKLNSLYDAGYHAPQIAKVLLNKAVTASNVTLARQLLAVSSSYDPKTELLLITLRDIQPAASERTKKDTVEQKTPEAENRTKPKPQPAKKPDTEAEPQAKPTPVTTKQLDEYQSPQIWEDVLETIKVGGHSVYGPLRLAEASFNEEELKLSLAFPFHIKRINEPHNLEIIHASLKDVTGKDHTVVVERINRDEKKLTPKPVKNNSPALQREEENPDIALMSDPLSIVKNVFGGAEVL